MRKVPADKNHLASDCCSSKPQRGDNMPAQGNALGNRFPKSSSRVRAEQTSRVRSFGPPCVALSGLARVWHSIPRALPWAVLFWPFRPKPIDGSLWRGSHVGVLLLVGGLFNSSSSILPLRAEPFVTGFERFHADQPTAEGGRLLFNELGCANCHGGEPVLPARRGPNLTGVTERVQAEWLRTFLANPSAARTGTTMPHLLPANDQAAVDAVVHYLGSLKPKTTSRSKSPRIVNAARGRELFHSLGNSRFRWI